MTNFAPRRKLEIVFLRLAVPVFLVLLFLAPLRAQDEPVHMTPEFALTFPLAKNGDDVTVKYPVLINPATVIKPGWSCAPSIFSTTALTAPPISPWPTKATRKRPTRAQTLNADQQFRMPPELAHELEGYRRTVWNVPNNFVLAMAQYPTDVMHLIYTPRSDNRDLHDERFSFFDGLFVGLPNGRITVLAVEKESKAEQAGIKRATKSSAWEASRPKATSRFSPLPTPRPKRPPSTPRS